MGEYFDWVNVDKKEYICPTDFDYGSKRIESCWRDNVFLGALHSLLANEWKGDRILWMGDEQFIPADETNKTLKLLYDQTNNTGDIYDTVLETYHNLSGLFKDAETEVREEIKYYLTERFSPVIDPVNKYRIDPDHPYDGLFMRKGHTYRYTINTSKKICYDRYNVRIVFSNYPHKHMNEADPLPLLMGYGRSTPTGPWVGDIIAVSNEKPADCTLLDHVVLDW